MKKQKPLDHGMIAGILGASEVRMPGYTAEEQPGGGWCVWGKDTEVPLCRIPTGRGYGVHSSAAARRIAVRIAQALNDFESED